MCIVHSCIRKKWAHLLDARTNVGYAVFDIMHNTNYRARVQLSRHLAQVRGYLRQFSWYLFFATSSDRFNRDPGVPIFMDAEA